MHLASLVFRKLARSAGGDVREAVVACAPDLGSVHRSALKSAAELAGLDTLRIVGESAAAAVEYARRMKPEGTVLFFSIDWAVDAAVARFTPGCVEMLGARRYRTGCGKWNWFDSVGTLLRARFPRETGMKKDDVDLARFVHATNNAAEKVMRRLASGDSADAEVGFGGFSVRTAVSRNDRLNCTNKVWSEALWAVLDCVTEAGCKGFRIDRAVLMGAAAWLPSVADCLRLMLRIEPEVFYPEVEGGIEAAAAFGAAALGDALAAAEAGEAPSLRVRDVYGGSIARGNSEPHQIVIVMNTAMPCAMEVPACPEGGLDGNGVPWAIETASVASGIPNAWQGVSGNHSDGGCGSSEVVAGGLIREDWETKLDAEDAGMVVAYCLDENGLFSLPLRDSGGCPKGGGDLSSVRGYRRRRRRGTGWLRNGAAR